MISRLISRRCLVLAWAVCVCTFIISDFFLKNTNLSAACKFASVVACFFIAVIPSGYKSEKFLKAAMFFTVLADLCLVILLRYEAGITFFCIAHTLYFIRNTGFSKKILVYPVFIIVFIAAYCLTSNYLVSICLLYGCCLISNVISSFFVKREKSLIAGGMVLFLLCDICVLLVNTGVQGSFASTARLLIWLFYAPSQLLLSLSRN